MAGRSLSFHSASQFIEHRFGFETAYKQDSEAGCQRKALMLMRLRIGIFEK